jgi:hypothetical protein
MRTVRDPRRRCPSMPAPMRDPRAVCTVDARIVATELAASSLAVVGAVVPAHASIRGRRSRHSPPPRRRLHATDISAVMHTPSVSQPSAPAPSVLADGPEPVDRQLRNALGADAMAAHAGATTHPRLRPDDVARRRAITRSTGGLGTPSIAGEPDHHHVTRRRGERCLGAIATPVGGPGSPATIASVPTLHGTPETKDDQHWRSRSSLPTRRPSQETYKPVPGDPLYHDDFAVMSEHAQVRDDATAGAPTRPSHRGERSAGIFFDRVALFALVIVLLLWLLWVRRGRWPLVRAVALASRAAAHARA